MMQKNTIDRAKKLYGACNLELLGGFDDNVFLSRDKNIVFKFLDTEQHKKENLLRELEIIKLMATHDINTPAPIPSRNGEVIEFVMGLKRGFYIIAFPNIEGRILLNYEEDNNIIKQWGRTLGQMHEISKKYAFKLNRSYLEWNHDINYMGFSKGTGPIIETKWRIYMERLSSLPCNKNIYGIVHHDLHNQNIMMSGDDMIVLDFGDVRNSWYAYDASIPIYHALEKHRKQSKTDGVEFYERFKKHFIEGYREKTMLSEEQYKLIPFFLEYRLLYSYLFFINSFKSNKVSTEIRNILDEMRLRIESDEPFVF